MDIMKIEQKTNLIREYVEDDDFDKAFNILEYDLGVESFRLLFKVLAETLVTVDPFIAKRFAGYVSDKYFDTVYARTIRRGYENLNEAVENTDVEVADETPATVNVTHTHTMTDPGHTHGIETAWYISPYNRYTRFDMHFDPTTYATAPNRRIYVVPTNVIEGMPYIE